MKCLRIRAFATLFAAMVAPRAAIACSPPAQVLEAGFHRDEVRHLPRNARGIMFLAPSIQTKVSDFAVDSSDDRRPLALRLHRMRDGSALRLELVGGFAPRARYTFRYLPAHEQWRYPDRVSVTIDDTVVDTGGDYAIALAPRPEVRMIVVLGSPACTEPAVALTQPFSYRVPPSLAAYRTQLSFSTDVQSEPQPGNTKDSFDPPGWPYRMASYHADVLRQDDRRTDDRYTGADDIVIATCQQRRLRGIVSGRVAFPEVDDRVYAVAPVDIDLGRRILGECRALDALTRTMQVYGEAKGLDIVCGGPRGGSSRADRGRTGVQTRKWMEALSILNDLSPTCELVALAQAVRTGAYAPDSRAMGRLGSALEGGMRFAHGLWVSDGRPMDRETVSNQAVDALDYLVAQVSQATRVSASAMLVPLLPVLVDQLAEAKPYRPDTVAKLIVLTGSVPDKVHARIAAIAESEAAGAPHARSILAALPGPGRARARMP